MWIAWHRSWWLEVACCTLFALVAAGCSHSAPGKKQDEVRASDTLLPDSQAVDSKTGDAKGLEITDLEVDENGPAGGDVVPGEVGANPGDVLTDVPAADEVEQPPACWGTPTLCGTLQWSWADEKCVVVPTNNGAPCDDEDACTLDDQCAGGVCTGTPLDCNDDNDCTGEWCGKKTGCQHYLVAGPCENDNLCSKNDFCFEGSCTSGEKISCDDDNPCTDDDCSSVEGCVHVANEAGCDDGNECTVDICEPEGVCGYLDVADGTDCNNQPQGLCFAGQCVCQPMCAGKECGDDGCGSTCGECDDGNPCTDDVCKGASGCDYVFNQVGCDDGDKCTSGDQCVGGTCIPGPSVDCDDGNECAVANACEPELGCTYLDVADGTDCNNQPQWHCLAGKCTCAPDTCSDWGYQCGKWSTGCPWQINCGQCPPDETCKEGTCVGIEWVGGFGGQAHDVAVNGNYAYVAMGRGGLYVFDISTPESPLLVSTHQIPGLSESVVVEMGYAYVMSHHNLGDYLRIFDVLQPANPTLVATAQDPPCRLNFGVAYPYAYCSSSPAWGNLGFADVSDPSSPELIASFKLPDSAHVQGLDVQAGYAYVAQTNPSRLAVLDLEDFTANLPTEIGFMPLSGQSRNIYLESNLAYLLSWEPNGETLEILIVDVSEPAEMKQVGSCIIETESKSWHLQVEMDYAYVASWDGISIVDVSSPEKPVVVGELDTMPGFPSPKVDIAVDQVVVAARDWGVKIVDVSLPALPKLTGSCRVPAGAQCIFMEEGLAHVGDSQGLLAVDLSDPWEPVLLGSYQQPSGGPEEWDPQALVGHNDHVYLLQASGGMSVVDVSDPSTMSTTNYLPEVAKGKDIVIDGNHAFVAAADTGLQIFDLAEPSTPELVGDYQVPAGVYRVRVASGYAYVGTPKFSVLDVHVPEAPELVTEYDHGVAELELVNGYLYCAHTLFVNVVPGQWLHYDELLIYDLVEPGSPTLVSSTDMNFELGSMHVSGNWLYYANNKFGDVNINAIDVTQPVFPGTSGAYATWPYEDKDMDDADWVKDIHVESGYLFAAAGDSGIQIFDVSECW